MDEAQKERLGAFARMMHKRTCPSISVLRKGGAEIEAHVRECPWCRDALNELPLYDAIARQAGHVSDDTHCLRGQIRCVRQDALPSLRDEHGWHKPPTVLVVETGIGAPGAVRVAMIHDEPALAADGDIPLGEEFEGMYAESWNTFPLMENMLTNPLGDVSGKVLSAVTEATQRPFPSVPKFSLMESFRAKEIDISAYFGLPAMERAVAWEEAYAAAIERDSLIAGIRRLVAGVGDVVGESLGEMLAGLAWPKSAALQPAYCAPTSDIPAFLMEEKVQCTVIVAKVDEDGTPYEICPALVELGISSDGHERLAVGDIAIPSVTPDSVVTATACIVVRGEKAFLPADTEPDDGCVHLALTLPGDADAGNTLQISVTVGHPS